MVGILLEHILGTKIFQSLTRMQMLMLFKQYTINAAIKCFLNNLYYTFCDNYIIQIQYWNLFSPLLSLRLQNILSSF